jgi:hypothetical protein
MRESVFLIALAMAATTVVLVVKTIVGALRGSRSGSDLAQLRDQVQQHAAALEEAENNLATQSNQIAELQERLDFTERLLAQRTDRPAVGPGA